MKILKITIMLILLCIVVQLFAWRCSFSNSNYTRKAPRTYVFSQAQLIYSLGKSDYFGNWVDRPLFINSALDAGKSSSMLMSDTAFKEMEKMALIYGLDGFAFFPETSRRFPFFDITERNDLDNFYLLPEFFSNSNLATKRNIIKKALSTKRVYKLNNKIVFTAYNTDIKNGNYAQWRKDINNLKREFGDCFYFLPSIAKPAGRGWNTWDRLYHKNLILSTDVIAIKNYLRQWLRISDGLYFGNVAALIDNNRNFDNDFYKNFVVKIFIDVLGEKEFAKKIFGLSALLGHENCTRFGYTLSSNGTQTFCESMETAINANPDIIVIPEWDEQNENTSLRPTVYNGLTSMRLMRYYMNRLKGNNQHIYNNESTILPNLIASYRKTLTLGEILSIDLLNVPDNLNNEKYEITFYLKSNAGKTVYSSSKFLFDGDSLASKRINLPSEAFSNYEVLYPQILITKNGNKYKVGTGFQPIYFNATCNWDYKWAKQDIRDILNCDLIDFTYKKNKENTFKFFVSLKANEPLAYVELLENNRVIYSYSKVQSDTNYITIKIAWDAMTPMKAGVPLNGTIQVKNADSSFGIIGNNMLAKSSISNIPNGLEFKNQRASMWKQWSYLRINKAMSTSGILKLNFPGVFVGEIPIQNLMDNKVYGISGKNGFNFVLTLFSSQDRSPRIINKKNVNFNRVVFTNTPNSIYQLQVISTSGKIYRSNCIIPHDNDTLKRSITVYSETKKRSIKLNVTQNRVPSIIYNFDPKTGSVLRTKAGKPFWGILGGYYSLATGIGGGGAGDDSPFFNSFNNFKRFGVKNLAPKWVKEGNEYGLIFNGNGQHLSLPQGVIPRLSAFTIEMDVKPFVLNTNQVILANRSSKFGTLSIELKNKFLYLSYFSAEEGLKIFKTNLTLNKNNWAHLKISYDLKMLTVSINDVTDRFDIKGPSLYDICTSVGGFGNNWFQGEIKNFSVYHFLK